MIYDLLSLCLAALPPSPGTETDRWPDYRGPSGDGQVESRGLPLRWSETENVAWKTPIDGEGWSTPAIGAGRIWMTSATKDGTRLSFVCVQQESGEVEFDEVLFEIEAPEPKHDLNSYASPSPVLADGRVFMHFGTYGTAAIDAESFDVLWTRRDLHIDHIVGPGSSPVVFEDLLIFNQDGGDQQYVIALDQQSGETAWRTDRSVDFGRLEPDLRKSYNTPIFVETEGSVQMISVGAEAAMAYDPRTGLEQWQVRYSGFSQASRPIAAHGMVYVNSGFMTASLIAVTLGGEGDVTDTHVAWAHKANVPTMSSPVASGDCIFFTSENGIFTCLDAKTGERRFRERIGGDYSASPIVAEGRVYFFDRSGECVVIKAAPEFEILAENSLDSGLMASPAVVDGTLYLRTKTHLYRIEQAPAPPR